MPSRNESTVVLRLQPWLTCRLHLRCILTLLTYCVLHTRNCATYTGIVAYRIERFLPLQIYYEGCMQLLPNGTNLV
jgi:hypothetical protein